jgi:hypothetical protein
MTFTQMAPRRRNPKGGRRLIERVTVGKATAATPPAFLSIPL